MLTMRKAAVLAASITLAYSAPAIAQNADPFVGGDYSEVTEVTIDDGHYLDYATFLASIWRDNQEFAKSQGWITGYQVMGNVHKRPGEPDLILIVSYKTLPTGAENDKRADQFRQHMKMTDAQMEAASGDRAKFRHVTGSQLWQAMNFRK
ncbi:MAG: hypothetical protein JSR28_13055 [Proteobacteria bacterium]|nr:hypothetical protein [Pseudomonadota bacterium]MDE2412548.1 hypothetical protein [Sphingomonadales bacterium]